MLVNCPDCSAPYSGEPPARKAAKVCKACGHAFLLSPDGTAESLKKEAPKPPPEPEPVAPPAPPEVELPPTPQNESPTAEVPPSFAQPELPPSPPESVPAPQTPFSAPSPFTPPAQPDVPARPRARAETPPPKPSKAPWLLLPVVLAAGVAVGFVAHPFVSPKPPPEPVAVAEPVAAPPTTKFLSTDAALWAGPSADGAYAQITTLPRGSALVVTTAEVDAFALVRDAQGRAGFLRSDGLSSQRQAGVFADCARAPFEKDAAACQTRAKDQLDACTTSCKDAACSETCKKNADTCTTGCAQVASVTAPAPAEPTPPPPPSGKKAKRKVKKPAGKKVKGGSGLPMPEPE